MDVKTTSCAYWDRFWFKYRFETVRKVPINHVLYDGKYNYVQDEENKNIENL